MCWIRLFQIRTFRRDEKSPIENLSDRNRVLTSTRAENLLSPFISLDWRCCFSAVFWPMFSIGEIWDVQPPKKGFFRPSGDGLMTVLNG